MFVHGGHEKCHLQKVGIRYMASVGRCFPCYSSNLVPFFSSKNIDEAVSEIQTHIVEKQLLNH
jgi:hypothetical protein